MKALPSLPSKKAEQPWIKVQNVHGNIINPFAAYIILQTSCLDAAK